MKELVDLIVTLKQKAAEHKDVLDKNETMTRYVLIDPLLQILGWDLSDPNVTRLEEPVEDGIDKIDYKMGRTMIIEAKSLNKIPSKKWIQKYIDKFDVQYGVVTNGVQWNVYVKKRENPEFSFNLHDDPKGIIPNAINLHRIIAEEWIAQEPTPEPPPEPPKSNGKIRIGDIVHPMKNHPQRLYFPDASSVVLHTWIDMLAATVTWLADHKHLKETHCPIQYTPKTTIVNLKPKHKDGTPFKHKKRVYRYYINSNLNQAGVRVFTVKLLDNLGIDSSKFFVTF